MEPVETSENFDVFCDATLQTGQPCRHLAIVTLVGLGFCDRHWHLLIGHIDQRHQARGDRTRRRISEAKRLERERAHVVYYVRRPDGFIKIGTTMNLDRRLQELRCVSPVEVIGTEPGDRRAEQVMHQIFRSLRRDGEWFEPGKRLLAYLTKFDAVA